MDQGEESGRSDHTVSYSVIPRSYCWGLNFPEVREKWAEIYDCQVDSCGEDPKAGVGIKGRAERGTTAQVIQIQRKEAGRNKFMCVLGAKSLSLIWVMISLPGFE